MKKMGGAMAMEKKRGRAQQQLYRTAKGGRTEKQHEPKAKLQLSRVSHYKMLHRHIIIQMFIVKFDKRAKFLSEEGFVGQESIYL
jgi:hypothetical protein